MPCRVGLVLAQGDTWWDTLRPTKSSVGGVALDS